MHCPECGQEILAGSEFCGNCGAPVTRQQAGPVCANCGSPNQPGAEFCAECGARLGGEVIPMQSFCPECGAAVKEGAAFCKECGADLNATTAPAPFVCPECGEPLPPDAAFCGNCGQVLQQGGEYAPAAPEAAATGNVQSFQPQGWEPIQEQQQGWAQQPQGKEYSQQQDWSQPKAQDWEYSQQQAQYPPQDQPQPTIQQQGWTQQQLQKSNRNKMLMAAAAAVILLVIGITGFWKPGFLRPSSTKLENGMLALNDITLDFKQTNLGNGAATMTTIKGSEEEAANGLIGDLYVMKIDPSCKGKVTVSLPVPKGFKPTTGNGLYIKLGVGRDYTLTEGKTARFYEYYDTTIKDGKAVAVIDPAAAGRGRHKFKASANTVEEKTPDVGEFTAYVGWFLKNGWYNEGEGFNYAQGHFRLWYNYNLGQGWGKEAAKTVPIVGTAVSVIDFLRDKKPTIINPEDAKAFLDDLEEAYNYYKKNGYEKHVDTFTPIDVYITRCNDEGGWQILTGNMELKESRAFGGNYNERYEGYDKRTMTKSTMYHEFFHAVQQSMLGTTEMLRDTGSHGWFDEATAVHFEKVVNPVDTTLIEREYFRLLWKGPLPEENTRNDGYARALLIDYISSKKGGNAWIKECYENWSADYSKLKTIMNGIAGSEADFAADFYMEVIKKLGHLRYSAYYRGLRDPDLVSDGFLSGIKLKLDEKTKEKIKNGEADAFPAIFFSPSFALGAYGGHVVVLEMEEDSLPDNGQLKLEAEGGCRLQVIKFKNKTNNGVSSKNTVIKNPKEELKKDNLYLVLVTSTQPKKQNIRLKATLELLKEGIYNGRMTMTQGKKTATRNNVVGFRISQGKDGKWGLNICHANGDYLQKGPDVPLTYDAKQKIWKGHRKFKEELSKDPKKSKAEVSTVDCTMKVNAEGKEPILIIDYKVDIAKLYIDYNFRGDESFKVHFEGKWSSDLKGKTLPSGKITILE